MSRFDQLRAAWRAAMRGRAMRDQDDEMQAIAIKLEDDGEWSCRWVGISPEMAARVLYTMADALVEQKIEPDPRWAWHPPAR